MNDFWKGFQLIRQEDNEVFCIAYGSNLDEARMKKRCPSAEVFGTSVIGGYRLLFKQSMTGAYATIEQDANGCVPVVIYRITAEDELKLDRFEGYPKYYYKRDFLLPVWGLNGRKKSSGETASATSCMNTGCLESRARITSTCWIADTSDGALKRAS